MQSARRLVCAMQCAMLCAALLAAGPSHGATYEALLGFEPSDTPGLAGYSIYVRQTGKAYGTPQDAGLPAPDENGLLSVFVSGLDVRITYVVAASAYTAEGIESNLSNELTIGYADVAPFVDSDGDGLTDAAEDLNLNQVIDPGETDPEDPDTDSDSIPDSADLCHGTPAGTAVNTQGCALCTTTADCDDANPCTVDTCDADGCRFAPVPNAIPCSDGVFCNGLETCQDGLCVAGSPPDCEAANGCTLDTCDETLDRCVHDRLPDCCASDGDCFDGDTCTTNERCEDGVCVSDPLACTGEDACTRSTCDPGLGCQTDTQPDGSACDDGDPCTEGDLCLDGTCGQTSGQALRVREFRLRTAGRRHRLSVRAVAVPAPELDVAASGAVLELIDSTDRSLYRGEVPGPVFAVNPSRRVFRFLDGPAWAPLPQANGLKRLIFRRKSKRMIVVAKAAASELAEALAEPTLTWVIRSGDACMSAPRLACSRASRNSVRCR